MTTLYHSKNIGATNGTRLNDPQVDALSGRGGRYFDDSQRQQIMTDCVALSE